MTTIAQPLTALVIYESMFGNTAMIARAIASGLHRSGVGVQINDVASAPAADSLDVDLLVLGAPTHAFSLSRPRTRVDAVRQGAPPDKAAAGLREWLEVAQPREPGPLVGVFDTRASKARRLPAAGAKAAKLARRHGFRVVSDPMAFLVQDVTGPLADGELERAGAWGVLLAGTTRDHRPADSGTDAPDPYVSAATG